MEGSEHLESQEEDCKNHRKREALKVSKEKRRRFSLEQKQKKPNLGEAGAFLIYKSLPSKLPLKDKRERYKEMTVLSGFPRAVGSS